MCILQQLSLLNMCGFISIQRGKRMRNGTGITIYLLYKHHFAETIQKLYWQNKFGDIVEAPVLYIDEWNNKTTQFE